MPSCGCKKETFKIAVRQNSPHTLRTPFLITRTHVTSNSYDLSIEIKKADVLKICLHPLTLNYAILHFHAPTASLQYRPTSSGPHLNPNADSINHLRLTARFSP